MIERLLTVGLVVAMLAASVQTYRLQTERMEAHNALMQAQEQAREIERVRYERTQELVADANQRAALARDAAVRADAAGQRLRDRVAALATSNCGSSSDTSVAGGGETAGGAGAVLADVQRRIDAAAGELAAIADRRGVAGQACVQAYESLIK